MVKLLSPKKSIKIAHALDMIILSILIFAFLGYSIYFRAFAELHIKLSFLNFPIFIGELLLFFCLVLTIGKWLLIKRKFKISCILLAGIYLIFVFVKVVFGYLKFGPLALRHAAIFYYPIFALIAYEVEPQLKKININILIISFIVYFILDVALYYFFIYLILMVIFVVKSRNKALKILAVCILLAFFPYEQVFIYGARTRLVGHITGITTIFILLFLSSSLKLKYKLLILTLPVTLFTAGFVKMIRLPRFQSLLTPGILFTEMRKWDKLIDENRKYIKLRNNIEVKLYNPEEEKNMPVTKIAALINENLTSTKSYPKPQTTASNIETNDTGVPQVYNSNAMDLAAKKQESNAISMQGTIQKDEPVALEVVKSEQSNSMSVAMDLAAKKQESNAIDKQNSIQGADVPLVKQESNAISMQGTIQKDEPVAVEVVKSEQSNSMSGLYNTSICRFLIWRDMLKELINGRRFFGFDFGKPLLPESIQLSGMAASEWKRDGWIASHNSFLEIIYRSGIVGILLIICIFMSIIKMARIFVFSHSFLGICVIGVIVYWLGVTLTYVTFEMPYSAITFWSIFGLALAHAYRNDTKTENR